MTLIVRGQFWANDGVLQPGQATLTHAHQFDHLTHLYQGPARLEALDVVRWQVDDDGKPTNQPADFRVSRYIDKPRGGWVLVTAHTWHRIINTGTQPLEYSCGFLPRDSVTGEPVDGMNGWTGAYQ